MMISLVVVVVVQLCFKLTTTGTCEGNIHKIHKQTLKLYIKWLIIYEEKQCENFNWL